jgi:hypothetical protein
LGIPTCLFGSLGDPFFCCFDVSVDIGKIHSFYGQVSGGYQAVLSCVALVYQGLGG